MSTEPKYLAMRRAGPRPAVTANNPHIQLSQNAPLALQERVFAFASTLPGVVVGPSHVSVPGARAFHLPQATNLAREAFMINREFAHLHPATDGSLHQTMPPEIVEQVIENGWAERHPLAGQYGMPSHIVMVYGPRDDAEFEVVTALISAAHAFANR